MKRYRIQEIVEAEPMTRGDYNNHRGWKIPEDENPQDKGYLIIRNSGVAAWYTKEDFERATFGVQY